MIFQEPFLNQLRLEQIPVNMYLNSGVRLTGVIESFDPHIILLRGNVPGRSGLQLVYKHAISSIVPQDHFEFSSSRHAAGEQAAQSTPTKSTDEEDEGFDGYEEYDEEIDGPQNG